MRSIKRVVAALFTTCLLTGSLLSVEAAETGVLRKAGTNNFANSSAISAGFLPAETSESKSVEKAGNNNSVEKGKKSTEKKSGEGTEKKSVEKASVEKKSVEKTGEKASKTEKASAAKTEKTSGAKTEKASAAKTEKTSEAKTEKASAAKTEKASAAKTEKTSEAKTEKTSGAKTGTEAAKTEKASETKTGTEASKTEKTSGAKTEKASAAKTEKASETKTGTEASKTEKTSGAKTEKTSEAKSGTEAAKTVEVKETVQDAIEKAKNTALNALSNRLSGTRNCVYVYSDYGLTGNHFTQKSKIYGSDDSLVKDMDENYEKKPYSGKTCIRCEQVGSKKDQGGWMFLNGYLKKWDGTPKPNDGKKGGAGLDLSGADALRFYARGKKGGEVVEFFTCGFGYDKNNKKTVDNPDSSTKKSTGQVKLTKDWKEYVIPLGGADLSYIVCGFGYEVSGEANHKKDIVFYMDEIRFTGKINSAQTAPVLLRSSDADDIKLKNAAFTEDNALAALAFLSAGKKKEAKEILDAFVYAVQNDRAYDSTESENGPRRVRNAYAAGDISAFPGWNSGTRLSGWYDEDSGEWNEDRHQVGSSTCSNSYVALALVQYYNLYGDETYLQTARSLMDWVMKKCFDHSLGYTRGFDGWKESDTLGVYPLTTRNTKDNLIAYAAFSRLYGATDEEKYFEASQYAIRFIENMYKDGKGRFVAETLEDGYTPDPRSIVYLDIQSLSALSMWDSFNSFRKTLDTIEDMKVKKGGYAFNRYNKNGGWWAEGTAFTALMYRTLGKEDKYEKAMKSLVGIQKENGLFPAATVKDLYTGVKLYDDSSLKFTKDTHIAPSAWFIMAANGYNPFAPHGKEKTSE